MSGELITWVKDARPVTIGVVGDLILDRYLRGDAERISPEAPIPVLDVRAEELRIGGAGNVVANVVAAGGRAAMCGVLGDDDGGRKLIDLLNDVGADVGSVVHDPSRPTIQKTRLLARSQQVLRYDREDRRPISGAVEERLVRAVRSMAATADLLVVSDYAKGTLTPAVLAAAFSSGKRVLVDPKGTDYAKYRGAYCITPNRHEAELATGVTIGDATSLERAAAALFATTGVDVALITLGADGMFCAERGGASFHIRTEAKKVFDVTGAGDTVIALLARYLAAGVPLSSAVRIANAGAGVVVGKIGAGTVSPAELYHALGSEAASYENKLVARERIADVARDLREKAMRIVFTNGCFDLLHAGHARYLAWARAQGDVLVVGVNSDASVRRLKGERRPFVTGEDRQTLLAALAAVDYVTIFDEDTPESLIRDVRPDVLVKGSDWEGKEVAGQRFVEAGGGRVLFAPLLQGRSTTHLAGRIQSAESAGRADPKGR
ncbi:MAG: D-glycero-beta-D-manno-heptose 1-phosphate adenylyltransferase [Planctomycetes bacterium]|nr:D-glycero-beta-D-manno-heptose 1-phosphate adenylyltransferase [Planctomycetota bacterium]